MIFKIKISSLRAGQLIFLIKTKILNKLARILMVSFLMVGKIWLGVFN